MEIALRIEMVAAARLFVREPVSYEWTAREYLALTPFFSNTGLKLFFIERMPEAVSTSLLAMYSRLKNPRGMRGNWVDSLLPSLLAPLVAECAAVLESLPESKRANAVQRWLKEHGLLTLDGFCAYSDETERIFDLWLNASQGKTFWRVIASGERIRSFLQMWLDAFGHNSIARTGRVIFCYENGSITVVKTLEWGRPAAGEIELSTRYVTMAKKGRYPIENELALIDPSVARYAVEVQDASMDAYATLMGDNTDGLFPEFLRQRWAGAMSAEDLKAGVFGESCDVLGNLLPCSALTSVGVSVSAEAFPDHIKHLYLDGAPEGEALAELICDEARRIGLGSFVRHERPSPWEIANWHYLQPAYPDTPFMTPADAYARIVLCKVFEEELPYSDGAFERMLAKVTAAPRGGYDKLPSQFESITANVWGVMTFRSWRDWQRMSFCSHLRSRVTPLLGFYSYPKSSLDALNNTFERIHGINKDLYRAMRAVQVPEELAEYPMALGNLVAYHSAANLRQWEFCNWQRSGFSVNDEVRGEFLAVEHNLRKTYPWWPRLSRADLTPHYVFARGKGPVVLP